MKPESYGSSSIGPINQMNQINNNNGPYLDLMMHFVTKNHHILKEPIFFEDETIQIHVVMKSNGIAFEFKPLELCFLQLFQSQRKPHHQMISSDLKPVGKLHSMDEVVLSVKVPRFQQESYQSKQCSIKHYFLIKEATINGRIYSQRQFQLLTRRKKASLMVNTADIALTSFVTSTEFEMKAPIKLYFFCQKYKIAHRIKKISLIFSQSDFTWDGTTNISDKEIEVESKTIFANFNIGINIVESFEIPGQLNTTKSNGNPQVRHGLKLRLVFENGPALETNESLIVLYRG